MATAIPPRAAEVASKRPVRQKFLCSEAGAQPSASSIGTGRALGAGNLRKGTMTWEKKQRKNCLEKLIFEKRVYGHTWVED
jgi:hypothetical protein